MPRAFPQELRDEVVAVARRRERSFSQIATEFGVSKSCVQNWVKLAEQGPAPRSADPATAGHKAKTRAMLSRLALEMFARDGYEQTSVAQIAKAAGVTQRTFFNYFDTKLDAVFHRSEYRSFATLQTMVASEPAGRSDLETLCACGLQYMAGELTEENHRYNRLRNRISESSDTVRGVRFAARQRLAAAMTNGLAQRHGRSTPDASDDVLGAAAAAVLLQCFNWWVDSDDPHGFESLARERIDAFLAAARVA
ncbi:MAG: TetR/AcrR family transcriptional regulator [Microbacterium sp.]